MTKLRQMCGRVALWNGPFFYRKIRNHPDSGVTRTDFGQWWQDFWFNLEAYFGKKED